MSKITFLKTKRCQHLRLVLFHHLHPFPSLVFPECSHIALCGAIVVTAADIPDDSPGPANESYVLGQCRSGERTALCLTTSLIRKALLAGKFHDILSQKDADQIQKRQNVPFVQVVIPPRRTHFAKLSREAFIQDLTQRRCQGILMSSQSSKPVPKWLLELGNGGGGEIHAELGQVALARQCLFSAGNHRMLQATRLSSSREANPAAFFWETN